LDDINKNENGIKFCYNVVQQAYEGFR